MAGTSAVRFPSAQPATGLPSFQRPPHHRRPRDGVENSTPRMLSLDKLKPLVGQTPSVAEFGANSATDNAPSADDDERKEHRSRCPLSKGDDS